MKEKDLGKDLSRKLYYSIQDLHKEYVNSEKNNLPQPSVELTIQEVYKLLEQITPANPNYNEIRALAQGNLTTANYYSVIIQLKDPKNG